ncbi:TPA: hypothetical protein ENS27_17980 [bacterium]|nr:hypothetical protein [bacterium]
MRKLSNSVIALMLFIMAIYLCSCATGGGSVDLKNDPIKPSPQLKEGEVNPSTNAITISRDGITVIAEHWSRARLDRKFTTSTQRSPFFYLETWPQSLQSEVFHITIKNETPRSLVFEPKDTTLNDERQYVLSPISLEDIRYKFVSKMYMDLKTKQGLDVAKDILLMEKLGPERLIPAGQTVEGFLAFYTPSSQAEKVWLIIGLEKEPAIATLAYEKVKFRFDFIQDLNLRKIQPATKR